MSEDKTMVRCYLTEQRFTYSVDTGTVLHVGFNTEDDVFRPTRVTVDITSTDDSPRRVEFQVFGPVLRNGKPLKAKAGYLKYTLGQFSTDHPIEEQRAPAWLRKIAEELGLL